MVLAQTVLRCLWKGGSALPQKADPGFVVKQWGSTGHDVKLTNMRSPNHDVVPHGFLIQRSLLFERAFPSERRVVLRLKKKRTHGYTKPTFSVEEQSDRPVTSQLTVQFKTRFLSAESRMAYAVKAGLGSKFGDCVCVVTQAWNKMENAT